MKKSLLFATLIVVLLASLFTTAALAKSVSNTLVVVNKTGVDDGAIISLKLVAYPGKEHSYASFKPGRTEYTITPANYYFTVTTSCGSESGWLSMANNRMLVVNCKDGELFIANVPLRIP